MDEYESTVQESPLEASPTQSNHPHRCFSRGLGCPLPDKGGSREVVTDFQSFHINILEAMAVFLTLKGMNPRSGSHIRLMLDNNTIVYCINRRGLRSPHIYYVIIAILRLAVRRRWHLSAAHRDGVRNVTADTLSRIALVESERSWDCV